MHAGGAPHVFEFGGGERSPWVSVCVHRSSLSLASPRPHLPDHLSFLLSGTLTSEPLLGTHPVAWRRCARPDLHRNSFSGSLRAPLLPCQLRLIQPVRQLYTEHICELAVPNHKSTCNEGTEGLTKGKDSIESQSESRGRWQARQCHMELSPAGLPPPPPWPPPCLLPYGPLRRAHARRMKITARSREEFEMDFCLQQP